ncbi:MAG: hypothetical protein JWN70_1048 [Planctomycetaceae bacterium]|nr:hypothetical protein [Planctomycetaceae bacterium]
MPSHILRWLVLSLLGVVATGCGGAEGVGRQPISGTVLMDGQPLDKGAINFQPYEGGKHLVGSGAVIQNGTYSIPGAQGLTVGKYMVAISAPETSAQSGPVSGQSPEDAMKAAATAGAAKERLPKKYNATTELMVDVTPSGPNKFDFKVDSIKR